jgi:hypothetical protein
MQMELMPFMEYVNFIKWSEEYTGVTYQWVEVSYPSKNNSVCSDYGGLVVHRRIKSMQGLTEKDGKGNVLVYLMLRVFYKLSY